VTNGETNQEMPKSARKSPLIGRIMSGRGRKMKPGRNKMVVQEFVVGCSEVAFCERKAGAGLEVSFEGDSPRLISETDEHIDPPRRVLAGVRRTARVMFRQSFLGVIGYPDLALVGTANAADDVDVPHGTVCPCRGRAESGLPRPPSQATGDTLRPSLLVCVRVACHP